jgi:MFS family permease
LRVLQGIAVGGEVPGAWVFVAEHVPARRVGIACASLTSGLTAGILLGSLLTAAIHERMTPAQLLGYGWRLPFLAGGVFGFVAVWLRRWLRETPVFEAMQARRALADELPLKRVLREHRSAVVRSMAVTWTLTAAIVVVILMTPTLVQAVFHLPPATAFLGNSLASFALAIGCLAYGAAADRFGVARMLAVGAVLMTLATGALYLDLHFGGAHFLPLYALAGFTVGVVGVVPTVMVDAFPPAVRFSGLSFSYNVAYAVFGGITPPLIGALVKGLGPLAPAYYVALAALAAVLVAVGLRGGGRIAEKRRG